VNAAPPAETVPVPTLGVSAAPPLPEDLESCCGGCGCLISAGTPPRSWRRLSPTCPLQRRVRRAEAVAANWADPMATTGQFHVRHWAVPTGLDSEVFRLQISTLSVSAVHQNRVAHRQPFYSRLR